MACECSPPKPYKFLRATWRDACYNPKCRIQGSENALPLLQILAGLVTQTSSAKNYVFEGGGRSNHPEQPLSKEHLLQQEMKRPLRTPCHQEGRVSNHSAQRNLQTLDWHSILFKITSLLPSGKYNMAFDPRNSSMSSNYIKPQGTSEAHNSVTLQLISASQVWILWWECDFYEGLTKLPVSWSDIHHRAASWCYRKWILYNSMAAVANLWSTSALSLCWAFFIYCEPWLILKNQSYLKRKVISDWKLCMY